MQQTLLCDHSSPPHRSHQCVNHRAFLHQRFTTRPLFFLQWTSYLSTS